MNHSTFRKRASGTCSALILLSLLATGTAAQECGGVDPESPLLAPVPVNGTVRAILVLAEFDQQWELTAECAPDPWSPGLNDVPAWANDLIRSSYDGATLTTDSSLTAFYGLMSRATATSQGAHQLIGTVYPHVVHLNTVTYYNTLGAQQGVAGDAMANKAVVEALDAAQFPFTAYTSDDEVVDFFLIFYRTLRQSDGTRLTRGTPPQPILDAGNGSLQLGTTGEVLVSGGAARVVREHGARCNAGLERRDFWTFVEIAAHEYGHSVVGQLDVAPIHIATLGGYGLMDGNTGFRTGVSRLSTYARNELGWIAPSQEYTAGTYPLTTGAQVEIVLTDIAKGGGDGFAIIRTADPEQYFILECTDSSSTALFSAGSRCQATPDNSGLMVYHVAKKTTAFMADWAQRFPPRIDPEAATGMFSASTHAPDPVAGWDYISRNETQYKLVHGVADLFRDGPANVSIMAPFTNPSTKLYWWSPNPAEYAAASAEQRKQQSIDSGLTFHAIRWTVPPGNGGAGELRVLVRYDGGIVGSGGHSLPASMSWGGDVRLMGDVEVTGALTVQPGARIICAADQDESARGGDPDRVEVNVAPVATLSFAGTAGDTVLATSSRDDKITHAIDTQWVDQFGNPGVVTPVIVEGENASEAAGDWVGVKAMTWNAVTASHTTLRSATGALNYSSSIFPDLSAQAPGGLAFENNLLDVTLDRDVFVLGGDKTIPPGTTLGILPSDAFNVGVDPSRVEIILWSGDSSKLLLPGTAVDPIEVRSASKQPVIGDWHGIRTADLGRVGGSFATLRHAVGAIGWDGSTLPDLTGAQAAALRTAFTFADCRAELSLGRDYTIGTGNTYTIPGPWIVGFLDRTDISQGGMDGTRSELIVQPGGTLRLDGGSSAPVALRSTDPAGARGGWYGIRLEDLTDLEGQWATIENAGGALSLEGAASAAGFPGAAVLADLQSRNLVFQDNTSDVCIDRDVEVPVGSDFSLPTGWRYGFAANRDADNKGAETGLGELVVKGEILLGDEAGASIGLSSNVHESELSGVAWGGILCKGEFTVSPPGYGYQMLLSASYIENVVIESAKRGVAIDTLAAPSLRAVTFVGDGPNPAIPSHIYLDSTDVVVPSNGEWSLLAGTEVVASNPGSVRDYLVGGRLVGESGKVDLIVQGLLVTAGVPPDARVKFGPETTSSVNQWGGIYFDYTLGASLYGARVRNATYPVQLMGARGPHTIRQTRVANIGSVGIWVANAQAPVVIDSCEVVRGTAGSGVGTTGIFVDQSAEVAVIGNQITFGSNLGSVGGEGVRIAGSKNYCLQAPTGPDSIIVRGNSIVGQARDTFDKTWSGVRTVSACGPGGKEVVIEGNTISKWSRAGVVAESSGDVVIRCNEIIDDRWALEVANAGEPGTGPHRVRDNLLYTYFVDDLQLPTALWTNRLAQIDDEAENMFVIQVANQYAGLGKGRFVTHVNPAETGVLDVTGNTWAEEVLPATFGQSTFEIYDAVPEVEARIDVDGSGTVQVGTPQTVCRACDCPGQTQQGGTAARPAPKDESFDGLRPIDGTALRVGVDRLGPVPMRDHLTLEFSVGGRAPQRCRIRVLDVQGRLIRTLAEGPAAPGRFRVDWNGRSDRGAIAAAGVYFLRVEIGDHTETRKVVRLR